MASTPDLPARRHGGGADLAFLVYDHLGSVVGLNLLWAALAVPWLAAAGLLGQASAIVAQVLQVDAIRLVGMGAGLFLCLYSPPTLFLLAATAPWVRGQETPSARSLWRILRHRWWPTQALGLLTGLLAALLLANVLFYSRWGGWPGALLGGLMLWLLLGLAVTTMYWLPLLVLMPEATPRQAVRQGLFLVFRHPGATLGGVVLLLAILALGLITGIGWLCGMGTVAALQLHLLLGRLLARHGADPIPSPRRSWRDLLRPWD